MKHFAVDYIGKPWSENGAGPDSFNCWGLVKDVLAKHYGLEVHDYTSVEAGSTIRRVRAMIGAMPGQAGSPMNEWRQVELPADGDIVVMGNIHEVPSHCGIYIETPTIKGVLHCQEGIGGTFEHPTQLRWGSVKFYRHESSSRGSREPDLL